MQPKCTSATQVTYPSPEVFVGQKAPTFSAGAVVDGEITSISLDDYKGKWVVLFFYPKVGAGTFPTR
eukprot:3386468-Pyramimonas_sp.AAC.1